MKPAHLSLLFAPLLLLACNNGVGGDGDDDCAIGSEGCPCTSGGGCDGELSCLSDTCVDTGQGGDGDGYTGDGDGNTGDGDGDTGDGDTGDGDGGGQVAQCIASCTSAADCVGAPLRQIDEDNWACTGGACVYLGCYEDADCEGLANNGSEMRCAQENVKKGQPKICLPTCSVASDCPDPDYEYLDGDANNYSCTGGICRFIGCQNDAECEGYVCRRRPSDLVDFCVPPCGSVSDCTALGQGAADLDDNNWECTQGGCINTGCVDDNECEEGNVCHNKW